MWPVPKPGARPKAPVWVRTGVNSVRHPRLAFSYDGSLVALTVANQVMVFDVRGRLLQKMVMPLETILYGLHWHAGYFRAHQVDFPCLHSWRFAPGSKEEHDFCSLGFPDEPVRDILRGPADTILCVTYVSRFDNWIVEEEMRRRMGAVGMSRISLVDPCDGGVMSMHLAPKPMWRSAVSASGRLLSVSSEGDDCVRVFKVSKTSERGIEPLAAYPVSNRINAISFGLADDILVLGEVKGGVHVIKLEGSFYE